MLLYIYLDVLATHLCFKALGALFEDTGLLLEVSGLLHDIVKGRRVRQGRNDAPLHRELSFVD